MIPALRRTIIAAALAVAGSQLAPREPVAPQGGDVVVVARKMRLVRLDYSLFGPYLRRCDVVTSSGNARIDRIMCAVLKRCIGEGHREAIRARACMHRRIDLLEDLHEEPATADPAPSAPTTPIAGTQDVIVRARRWRIEPGEWRFTVQRAAMRSSRFGTARNDRWTMCIAPGELRDMVERMVGGGATRSANGQCSAMRITLEGNVISGERRCMFRDSRSWTRIDGRFDEASLAIARQTQSSSLAGGPSSQLDEQLNGRRMGVCAATSVARP